METCLISFPSRGMRHVQAIGMEFGLVQPTLESVLVEVSHLCCAQGSSDGIAVRLETRLLTDAFLPSALQASRCCNCLVEHTCADRARCLPIQAHGSIGIPAEHLKSERICAQSEDTLFLGLHSIDNRSVGDLPGTLDDTEIVGDDWGTRLLQQTHRPLQETSLVLQDYLVNFESTLRRIPHRIQHRLPSVVFTQLTDWL